MKTNDLLRSMYSVLLIFSSVTLPAQTIYYVAASGNDAAAGTSQATAWKTLAKVNSTNFSNGDVILLRRGDTFAGQLRIQNSGITIDAYGTGNKPVITGAEQITTTWIVNSGSIWETTFASGKPAAINNLFDGTVILPISRYPNKTVNNGYLNYESHSGPTQLTDDQLGATPSWTGSNVVVRSERFRLVRTSVLSHSGNTLTLPATTGMTTARDGYGCFFVNDLKAIDAEGEWAYAPSTGKVYLYSVADPNTKTLFYPKTDTTVYINSAANVTLKNLDIRYAAKIGLCIRSSSNSTIDSVSVVASGGDGVVYNAATGSTFQNSIIDQTNWSGIFTNSTSSQLIIRNNVIINIGNEAFGKSKTFIGIDCASPDCQILNNRISKTGYTGIISGGVNNLIKRNIIDSVCLYLEDMGGIYTNNNIGVTTGTIIEENIVTNSIGEMLGAPGEYSKANGIYLDNLSQGVTVRNNTVAFVNGSGLFTNAIQAGNQIYNNTSYQSGVNELGFNSPTIAPGYIIKENILVTNSVSPGHNIIQSDKTGDYSYSELGTFTDNFIINPFNSKAINFNYSDGGISRVKRYTPYEWESQVKEVNGTVSAFKNYPTGTLPADVIRFYYNTGDTPQSYTLPSGLFVDARNQDYCSTVTLEPFTSVILFKVDTGSCITPVACGQPAGPTVVGYTDSTAHISWSAVTGALNYDVRYRLLGESGWKYASNIQATSFTLEALKELSTYECQIRSSCYGSEGNWVDFPGFTTAKAPYKFTFINANYSNCAPATAFATTHSDTDNKWTLQNSGGIGTVDADMMRSSSATEDAPEITLSAPGVLDSCSVYDIYLYYLSPATQPWKTKARLADSLTMKIFDRNTPGAELLVDRNGNTPDRLFRAKLGTVSNATSFSVVIDDYNYGPSSARSVFDGVGFIQTGTTAPAGPSSLQVTQPVSNQAVLSWQDNSSSETGFIVERKTIDNNFQTLASLAANSVTYTDNTISSDTTYYYRVYAVSGGCTTDYSNVAATEVVIDTLSSGLMGTRAESSDKQAEVHWHTEHEKSSDHSIAKTGTMIYPNPFEDTFTIKPDNNADAKYTIRLMDMNGKTFLNRSVISLENQLKIDASFCSPGIYILEIKDDRNKIERYKIIKK